MSEKAQPTITYDKEHDVLYAFLRKSESSSAVEVSEGVNVCVSIDEAPAVTGVTIVDFSHRFENQIPRDVVDKVLREHADEALAEAREISKIPKRAPVTA